MTSEKSTLKLLAKITNKSVNTVSRALNNKDGVSEETRAMIKRTAEEYNYIPDIFAQSLRGKTTNLVGMLVEDVTNPFFTRMLAGAEQEAKNHNISLLIGSSNEKSDQEKRYIEAFRTYKCSGMALCLFDADENLISDLIKQNFNLIVLDAPYDKRLGCNRICFNYKKDSKNAVEYLIQQGHKKIAMINPKLIPLTEKERFEGYINALKDNNIRYDESIIKNCMDESEAYSATLELLSKKKDITALYLTKSAFGLSVLSAIFELNLSIPEDISLMMFGYSDWVKVLRPRISCMKRPVFEMGKKGIEILMKKHLSKKKKITLSSELLIGDSVKTIK